MSTGTIKKDSGFGVAQLILFISIAVLVIFVAWPVLLILFNAFFVDGSFNSPATTFMQYSPSLKPSRLS